jgi:hypothetical protein
MKRRPFLPLAEFRTQLPTDELQQIMDAVNRALNYTAEKIGTDHYWPLFKAIYSATAFPQIYGQMEEVFGKSEDWQVKRMPMTFTLIKKGVCQFHFYKGNGRSAFKAQSKRQKAIINGDLYADLENLPSIILRHSSDKLNSQLIGFHALFFKGGVLIDDFDIMNKIELSQTGIREFANSEETSAINTVVATKFTPKAKKKPGAADGNQQQVS